MENIKKQKKLILILSIALTIFSIGIVDKEFENDTFFNIAIGKYILNNGIDMQEHFSWVPGLTYTYSHWAFDILIYLIYNAFDFVGIYYFTIILSVIITLTLFLLLSKKCKSPVIAAIIALISIQLVRQFLTARSQIISFLCFIIEIYCIEQFIDTNQKKYAFTIIALAIIVANFHAPAWTLFVILFLPYIACDILNYMSFKNIYKRHIKKLEKNLNKLSKDSEKYSKSLKDKEYYEKLLEEEQNFISYSRTIKKESYNFKNLIILMIIIMFTGLLTPTHGTPYTYIIHSMFGESNFENGALSIDYILEMKPCVPISNISIMTFTILFLTFTIFMPAKLKVEHGFLVLGLYIMALSSVRYVALLVLLGSYVLCDLFSRNAKELIPNDINSLENYFTQKKAIAILLILAIISTSIAMLSNHNIDYVNKKLYPIEATQYIKNNIDYKNMKIFNSYNNGSYLMLNDIPVFIDSRLDVYCSEFNKDTAVFKDFCDVFLGNTHYEDIFSKYDCTHILVSKEETLYSYIRKDNNYITLYEDDSFILYKRMH